MSWNNVVKRIVDGEQVSAAELNPILATLVDRDQYLFNQIGQYADKSVLLAYNLLVNSDTPVTVGQVAYFKEGLGLTPAKVGFDSDFDATHFSPMHNSFAVGLVKEVIALDDNSVATVYLQGLVEGLDIDSLLQTGESFEPDEAGPLYLSKTEAGKLTKSPGGLSVYVGFAFNNTTLLLHPNYDSLNQLFFNYKFDLVDRPAGIPLLTDTTWTVAHPDVNKVGWLPVASSPYSALAPAGAVFIYNLPADATISADVSLSTNEKAQALALKHALPPYPHYFTTVTVNGVQHHAYDADHTDGTYLVNNAGLWWFKNTDESQPWASDIRDKAIVTFDTIGNFVEVTTHGLEAGDAVSFLSSNGALPSNVELNTVYYVIASGITANKFKISTTVGGSALTLGSLVGTPTVMLSWLSNKGSTAQRPKQQVSFVKLNPDYKTAMVTSIQPYVDNIVDSGKSIKLISAEDNVSEKSTGDLLLKFQLGTSTEAQSPVLGSAVKSVAFNNLTGELEVKTGDVVTGINYTEGLIATPGSDGVWTISLANFTAAGDVADIEPEDCDYVYKGLHSYLRLKNPAGTARTGFVGKVKLPASIPTGKNFKVKLLMFGTNTSANSARFKFEYSVSTAGAISDTVTKTNSGNDITVGGYTANTAAWMTHSHFQVPAAALSAGAFVNFRLARVNSSDYTHDIGVLGVAWAIE